MRRIRVWSGLCAAAVVSVAGASGVPAHASEGRGVISGSGYYKDDWSDEGIVSTTSHRRSNVAALWQAVLWADKSLKPNGNPMSVGDIDCVFGPQTEYTTKRWQRRYASAGLESDGIVGRKTWSYAARKLDEGGGNRYVYHGLTADMGPTGRTITFVRAANGVWSMYLRDDLEPLYYNSATFSSCG
ncbi:peptidoglycan-binding protein [Streptomyces monticola]|uniref:Peptidoglycan-binding protein n=1 Tax=Streptomyces monticola TaxID=2666263 RepID=A0ABW2JPE8_9ACTN